MSFESALRLRLDAPGVFHVLFDRLDEVKEIKTEDRNQTSIERTEITCERTVTDECRCAETPEGRFHSFRALPDFRTLRQDANDRHLRDGALLRAVPANTRARMGKSDVMANKKEKRVVRAPYEDHITCSLSYTDEYPPVDTKITSTLIYSCSVSMW